MLGHKRDSTFLVEYFHMKDIPLDNHLTALAFLERAMTTTSRLELDGLFPVLYYISTYIKVYKRVQARR